MRKIVRTVAAASVLACLIAAAACTGGSGTVETRSLPQVGSVDFAAVRDGEYEGYYKYYNLADARVRVTVAGGRVTSIRLLRHFHFPFISGARVAQRIVQRQTLDVDVVSGATGSSIVVQKAVEAALRQGL